MILTHISTACILIDIGGFRILTDPVFDAPGKRYHFGFGAFSKKSEGPALQPEALGNIDLMLISHHQHGDNLDDRGKELMLSTPQVVSTKAAARVYPHITGLDPWDTITVQDPRIRSLKITALPAQHHPWWLPHFFAGDVIGFMLEWEGQENGAVYISGDTVYFNGIEEISKRFKVDTAIVNVGAVQFRYLTGTGRYTFNGKEVNQIMSLMKPRLVIPLHTSGWSHFKEGKEMLLARLKPPAGTRVVWLKSGEATKL